MTIQSGLSLDPGLSVSRQGLAKRPDRLPGVSVEGPKTASQWFNPAAFRQPAPGFFGNFGVGSSGDQGSLTSIWPCTRTSPFPNGGERSSSEVSSSISSTTRTLPASARPSVAAISERSPARATQESSNSPSDGNFKGHKASPRLTPSLAQTCPTAAYVDLSTMSI